ncbi:MAG: histidine phosphatase family protein [Bryobacteraceae bacterium]
MSAIYLIRHGQAGSRENYDLLSDTGRRQARLLGEYFCVAGIRFTAAYAGSMRRQRETAELVLGGLSEAPELTLDARWDEFSLEGLWEFLAPRLLEDSNEFRTQHERFLSMKPDGQRTITACDVELIRAWISDSYRCPDVEPWPEFRKRTEAPFADLMRHGPGETVAVFTSATPTAIWCALALGLEEQNLFQIAAVLLNSNFTTFRIRDDALRLFSLNNTPHLIDPALRTFY